MSRRGPGPVRVDLTAAMRDHVSGVLGAAMLFQPCPVCGDDIDIHEWVDVIAAAGRIVACDRDQSGDPR